MKIVSCNWKTGKKLSEHGLIQFFALGLLQCQGRQEVSHSRIRQLHSFSESKLSAMGPLPYLATDCCTL
jgi:hypothetical protein